MSNKPEQNEPIAIVGIGLRFPGGNESPEGFAEFLGQGRSGIRPVPEDRWDVPAFKPADAEEKGKVHTTGAGFLDQIDQFDAQFFNISPKEANFVDPQQRLLLETAWEALENANIDPGTLRHSNGGVYIGASSIDYALEMEGLPYEELDGHLAAGITLFPLSGRLSYFLGLRGPSLSVDTACASSLTAMHLAVEGLRSGATDIALSGAVNCLHHPRIFVMFSQANMLAPDGRCKTFDESADGYVRAEGCAVLVLKRLSDAERDGDRVLALIRGTAIGEDGESAGLTVPNGTAQEIVIRSALRNAHLEPADIQYVEAHGTGTPLGDPIEMGAISDVFAKSHTKENPVTVGSLKTNLGHMEPVAGIGGVIKTVLQMRTGTVFPHLNLSTPSGRIPWDSIPVTVPTEARPWKAETRRAVVNSFGFAGSIAAAVLEEAPAVEDIAPAAAPEEHEGGHVFTLSAKTKRSLQLQVERYRRYLEQHPELDVADLCFTANTGRSHFAQRIAGNVADREELAALLAKHAGTEPAGPRGDIRKVAFLFTGQGSQYAGMGAALYRQFPLFAEHVDECDRLFAGHLGRSVREIMFDLDGQGEALGQTLYAQPALFTLEYALAKLWMSWGVKPNVLIGHSIGEVVAAAVAGLFGLADAAALVSARASLMQSVTAPGGMAAVSAPVEEVAPLLEPYPDLAVAAVNSPQQTVISGGSESLATVVAQLTDAGLTVKQLKVSHAFHSPLMAEVFDDFRAAIAHVRFREPSLTLISNLTGKVARFAELSDPEYWIRHIGEAVEFSAGMKTLERRGKHAIVEIGPSPALTGAAKQSVTPQDHLWIGGLSPKETAGRTIRAAIAQFYAAGLAFSWSGYHAGRPHRLVSLPGYAFDRKSYWLPNRANRHGLRAAGVDGRTASHPLLGSETTTPEQLADGIREFSSSVSPTQPAYLGDHVAMGQVVFPGTGYLEIVLALLDAVHGHTRRPVRDVGFREALFLDEERATRLRTRLRTGPDGTGSVEIVSLAETRDAQGEPAVIERLHAVAVIGAEAEVSDELTGAAQELLALAEAAERPEDVLRAEDVYAAYSGAGLDYGPEFRLMRSVHRYPGDLTVGDLEGRSAGALEHMPPALLDAAMHNMAALADDGNDYLPVRFGRFRLFRKPKADTLRTLLRVVPADTDEVDLSADLLALDGDRPVFELKGLGLKRVAETFSGARRSFFHEMRWVKRSLAGANSVAGRHLLVVGRDAAEFEGALPRLAEQGGSLSFAATAAEVTRVLAGQQVTDLAWYWQHGDGGTGAEALRAESELNYRALLELLAALEQAGFGRNQRLWLVTERSQVLYGDEPGSGSQLAASSLWGFGHTLLNEFPAYRTTLLDLPGTGGHLPLLDELHARETGEFQVAYREGFRHVRRLLAVDPRARQDANFGLAIKEYGQFGGIKPVPAEEIAPVGDQIQVEVHAAGLNFKDVLNALGMLKDFGDQPLGFECAGTVLAAGPEARFAVGDEVILNYLDLFKRRVTVPSAVAVRKPANIDFTAAAGLISVYVTAYYALHHLAGIKQGDRVLVHAAAGGVGQAAAHLARLAGAEVFATASPHKWPLLKAQGIEHVMNSRTLDFADEIERITGGRGVDIVLNSLNKDYIPAGMRALGTGGRFIELGKVGAWTPEQVAAERPDVTYHNFDLSELPQDQLIPLNQEIMRTVIALVESGQLPPIVATAYTLDEVEEAFGVLSRGANVGKLVLDFAGERAPAAREVAISPDRTYLITGGLGALGLVTAEKLVDLGARHLALVSRRPEPVEDVKHLFDRLAERAEVTVLQGDIAEPADVARIMAALAGGAHPVAGIIHSAGTVDDRPVPAQTWESLDEVFRAKVYGTWLLHEAAAALPDLDFFVGYSSAASVVGAPGQSNYAAANYFLDTLLHWRAGQGLPALSVNWGPWAEVGMSARLDDSLIKKWEDEGIRLFTPAKGTRALASVLGRPVAQVVAGEADWDRFTAAKPVSDALYELLVKAGADSARTLDLDALTALPKAERLVVIDEFVRSKVADVLHFEDADAIDSYTEFVQLGLDSLVAVELKNSLEAAFRVPLPPSLAFDHPSAGQLSEFLEQQITPAPAAA
ncbi:type I polyketide synthase [Kitasatospora sp. MBT63]|uniref:type I polyketide synthase n=1 Tax=Kitasatospora sp. MBT63 TaxID=1444768 RepID=UPI000539B44B|nr:type I polyketide synthase [Kitasatospora sp. MBT63]